MKKTLITVLNLLLLAGTAFAQYIQYTPLNMEVGSETFCGVDAKFVYAQNDSTKIATSGMNIPGNYPAGVFIMEVEKPYYYNGEECTSTFQLVISGVTVNSFFNGLNPGMEVNPSVSFGTINNSNAGIVARSKTLDPFLAQTSTQVPMPYDGWFYYTPDYLLGSRMKWLTFKPVESKNDTLVPGNKTKFKDLAKSNAIEEMEEKLGEIPSIRIKTKLTSLPGTVSMPDNQEFYVRRKHFSNTPNEAVIKYNGKTLHLMFQNNFVSYLKQDYILNTDIYLYINPVYSYNKELYCYVRDYSPLVPFEESDSFRGMVKYIEDSNKMESGALRFGMTAQEFLSHCITLPSGALSTYSPQEKDYFRTLIQKAVSNTTSSLPYVDLSVQEIPEGITVYYERFFNVNAGVAKENKNNITEYWYDQNDRLVRRSLWYDPYLCTPRHITIYTYDDQERLISRDVYQSKLLQVNGNWVADPTHCLLDSVAKITYDDSGEFSTVTESLYRCVNGIPSDTAYSIEVKEYYNDGTLKSETLYSDYYEGFNYRLEYDTHGNGISCEYHDEDRIAVIYTNVYENDLLVSRTQHDMYTGEERSTQYQYDSLGRVTKIWYNNDLSFYMENIYAEDSEDERPILVRIYNSGEISSDTYPPAYKIYKKGTNIKLFDLDGKVGNSYHRYWFLETRSPDQWTTPVSDADFMEIYERFLEEQL